MSVDMSTQPLTISVEADAFADVHASILSLLADEASSLQYPMNRRRFCASLRNEAGGIEGGIVASCYWEWLDGAGA